MTLRFYWEKAKLLFGGDGSGIRVKVPGARILSSAVNNESSLIDLSLSFAAPLTEAQGEELLDLTFGREAKGLGRVESKLVEFSCGKKVIRAENQRKYIFVEAGE